MDAALILLEISRKVFILYEFLHESVEGMGRKPFYIVEVALNAANERASKTLDCPASSAVDTLSMLAIAGKKGWRAICEDDIRSLDHGSVDEESSLAVFISDLFDHPRPR